MSFDAVLGILAEFIETSDHSKVKDVASNTDDCFFCSNIRKVEVSSD